MNRAVIVLGHGSRSAEASEQFMRLAATLAPRLPGASVQGAFMELAKPSLEEAVEEAVARGAEEVHVLPCFLFLGNHIKHDIPKKVGRLAERFPQVTFVQHEPIGPDPRVGEALLERLGWSEGAVWGELGPEAIERESMRVIDAALEGFDDERERAVVRRLIHASGDLSLQSAVGFSAAAVDAGVAALAAGAPVITDVRMVEAGIDRRRLAALGGATRCLIDDAGVAEEAEASGRTRAATAMRRLSGEIDGAVVAVGNAPTALREVLALAAEGVSRPALVVGIPVGFVDAPESKAALEASGLSYVTVRGSRGGSPLAAAAVNALLRIAEEA